jgi:3-oxoacyl-[acyl-carrier-protein] synthase II
VADRRVVITGLGAITPLGASVSQFWDGLVSGRCGVQTLERFESVGCDVNIGGQCLDFDATRYLEPRVAKRMDRFAQFAFAAAQDAAQQAGIKDGTPYSPERAGVILGTGIGGLQEIEDQHLRLLQKGPSKVSAFTIPKLMANAGPGHISIALNLRGPSSAVATACASAGSAMGEAYDLIRSDAADVMITGGSEAACTPLGVAAFAAMKALSTRNDEPERASRPFDKDRDGFVLAEGAGLLVFEEYEHARKRGANILCEVIGFGASTDAYDIVQPDEEGRGAARSMAAALQSAGINPSDVDYINAHGTSTILGDIAETKAIKSIFGAEARNLAVSSTKSSIGHLLGASGGVELIACIMAIQHQTLPPTINLDAPIRSATSTTCRTPPATPRSASR